MAADRSLQPSGPELTRRHTTPAHKGMAKTRGLAEAQRFGNLIDRQLILAKHLLGLLEAQFVEQLLVAATHVLEMPAQGPRRTVHLLGQPLQPGRGIQLRAEQLADPSQPGLSPGELDVLFATTFGHGLMGDHIGQRQRLVEPALVKGEGIVARAEVHRAIEVFGVACLVVGRGMFEACAEQGQRMAEQVVAGDFQRHQAELGVEHRHGRALAVIGGGEPDAFSIVFKAQFEKCSQQRRITHRQTQSVTEGGTGEQGVTEHAVAGDVHPPAQFQADVTLERDSVGADLHFLIGGDARVGTVQIRRTDAASGQQCFAGQALCLEGIEYQGDGIEGGEVGVEHKDFQPWDSWNTASYMPSAGNCRSEPAREKPESAAGCQAPGVIVNDHR